MKLTQFQLPSATNLAIQSCSMKKAFCLQLYNVFVSILGLQNLKSTAFGACLLLLWNILHESVTVHTVHFSPKNVTDNVVSPRSLI